MKQTNYFKQYLLILSCLLPISAFAEAWSSVHKDINLFLDLPSIILFSIWLLIKKGSEKFKKVLVYIPFITILVLLVSIALYLSLGSGELVTFFSILFFFGRAPILLFSIILFSERRASKLNLEESIEQ